MKKPLSIFLSVTTLTFATGAFQASQAALLGVTFLGDVYSINESTGAGVFVGSTGSIRLNSLTEDGAGGFISATSASPAVGGGGDLVSINGSTGSGTVGPSINLGATPVSIRGLAISPTGTLFASNNPDPGSVTAGSQLYTIDTGTGVGSLIGLTGLIGMQALTFSSSGTLYGWNGGGAGGSITTGLVTLDTTTGQATDVNAAVDSQGLNLQSITFGLDGTTMYGATLNELYQIDTASGVATLIGTGSYSDIRGIAAATVIPVPAAVWLFVSGLAGLAALARRKAAA